MLVTEPANGGKGSSDPQPRAPSRSREGAGETEQSINHKVHYLRMKMLQWWKDRNISKAKEAPVTQKPELQEEPGTAVKSAAETAGHWVEVSPWAGAGSGRQPGCCTAEVS